MGGSVSTVSSNEGAIIARYLRTNLERYEALELTDEEIRVKLTDDFNEIRNEIKTPTPINQSPEVVSVKTVATTKLSGKGLGKPLGNPKARTNGSGKGPVMVRRRSFGNISEIKLPKKSPEKKSDEVAIEKEPKAAPEPEPVVEEQAQMDSWDSVKDQPFCNICAMAFKTMSNYDRHVKYSDMHINNVKKIEDDNKTADTVVTATIDPELELAEKRSKQVEGDDYRLLYSGSKFFWQNQETVDIQIYHHIVCNTLEVVAYDLQRNKELQRVYLSYPVIMGIILPTVITQVDAERQITKEQNRFATLIDRDIMIEDATRHAYITYILNHLKYTVLKEEQEVTTSVYLGLSETELLSCKESPALSSVPQELVPVYVAHRRRTSTEEITAALNNLDDDRSALKVAIERAEKISDLVNKAASMLNPNKYAGLSKYQIKWQKSIRKVLHIKFHQKVLARLDLLKLNIRKS